MSYAMITVAGNVTGEPKVRAVSTKAGERKVMSFSVATDYGWGERKESTFWDVQHWLASDKAEGYMMHAIGKGAKVTVSGEAYIHKYTAQDGTEHRIARIDATKVEIQKPVATVQEMPAKPAQKPADPYGDDLPF